MNADRAIGIGAFLAAGTILAAFAVFGLTLNTTPSYPRGLWRQVAVAEPPVIRGRMALACPPPAPAFDEAVRRGRDLRLHRTGPDGSLRHAHRASRKRLRSIVMGADLTSNRVGSRAGASAARAGLGGPSAAASEPAGPPAVEACARRRDSPGDRAAAAASPRSTSRGGGFGTTTGPAGVIPTCTKAKGLSGNKCMILSRSG